MKYTIRKGLESPCKIRGLLSTDYWLMVAWLSSMLIMLFLSIRSGFTGGNWDLFLLITIISITVTPFLYCRLKGRARERKFDERKQEITISNLTVFKTIMKNEKR